jgi:hypothetical protein
MYKLCKATPPMESAFSVQKDWLNRSEREIGFVHNMIRWWKIINGLEFLADFFAEAVCVLKNAQVSKLCCGLTMSS